LAPVCKDTFEGHLRVRVFEPDGTLLFDHTSVNAGLEIGGGPWTENWSARASYSAPIRTLLDINVDLDEVFQGPATMLRPPGL